MYPEAACEKAITRLLFIRLPLDIPRHRSARNFALYTQYMIVRAYVRPCLVVDTSASIGGVTKLQTAACVPVEKIPHGRKSRYDGISQ